MSKILFLVLLFFAAPLLGIEYQIHVVYPVGTKSPGYSIQKFKTTRAINIKKVALRESEFSCTTQVTGLSKGVYLTQIECKTKDGKAVQSNGTCTDKKIQTGSTSSLVLLEPTPTGKQTQRWEHTIHVECNPGQKSLIEKLLKM